MKFSRIYYKDRYTNEIWFYMAMPTRISLDYLEWYMKANNKKFLYITNIEYGKTQAQNQQSWKEYSSQHVWQTSQSKEEKQVSELYQRLRASS